jgi:hypothetical protein
LLWQTNGTGAITLLLRFGFIAKKDSIFYFHPLTSPAIQPTVNFAGTMATKRNLACVYQGYQLTVPGEISDTQVEVTYHAAS